MTNPSFPTPSAGEFSSQGLITQNTSINAPFLPRVLRVLKITYYPEFIKSPYPVYQALLFAQGLQVAVQWDVEHQHNRLPDNQLVTIKHLGEHANFAQGYLHIENLCRLDRPDTSFNIFSTAPLEWFANKPELYEQAHKAWELLDEKNRGLLNAVLFDGDFFKRFCTGPSSVAHHHNYPNGNLEHTLEVVFNIASNIHRYKTANLQLALIFGWLHDMGKVGEYKDTGDVEKPYKLTPSGCFHGHKMNGLNTLVKAQTQFTPLYPECSFNNLRHLMEATESTGSSGLRQPQMLEFLLVANADSASAAANVFASAYQPGQSWGVAPGKNLNFRYEE
jgi:3'-5' exoribonuclease